MEVIDPYSTVTVRFKHSFEVSPFNFFPTVLPAKSDSDVMFC